MQDLSSSRRAQSAQTGGSFGKSRRALPRGSPRSAPKPKVSSFSPRGEASRNSLRSASGTSPRIASSSNGHRSPPVQRRPTGCPPRQPVTRSATSPSPAPGSRRDASPSSRARCRSPTPDNFRRTSLMPNASGGKAPRLRSPAPSLIPPMIQGVATAPAAVATSSAPSGELSRTWSFPGPPRPGRDSSPTSHTSPRRMSSITSPSLDRLSRSWAFRPSTLGAHAGQARNLSDSFDGALGSATISDSRSAKRRFPASSSVTLPVSLAKPTKDIVKQLVQRPRASSSDRLEGLGSDASGSFKPSQPGSRSSTPSVARERASSPPIPQQPRPCISPACSTPQLPQKSTDTQRCKGVTVEAAPPAPAGLGGLMLLHAALGMTPLSEPDDLSAKVSEPVPSAEAEFIAEPPALSPSNADNKARAPLAATSNNRTGPTVEENQDPNIAMSDNIKADVIEKANKEAPHPKVRPPPVAKGPPAVPAENQTAAEQGRGSTPRLPPNSWHDKSTVTPEETWICLDGLRLRMEMLPGGLVIERDTNITDVAALIGEMQSGQTEPSQQVTQAQASRNHSEILAKLVPLTELVEAVEAEYWRWCVDADAAPLDMLAKQQVHDWLAPTGEKVVAVAHLRDLGARRCLGTCNSWAGDAGQPCIKFLQYGLHKSLNRRCPTCSKEYKRLTAIAATDGLQCAQVDAEGSDDVRTRSVSFSEGPPPSIPVESRELAWAVYGGCPGTYFRAYVLPSDLEIAKENGTQVQVSWVDGDRKFRQVTARDVIMMDHPLASQVTAANAATWNTDACCLMPRIAAK